MFCLGEIESWNEIVGWKYFSFRILKTLRLCVLASKTVEKTEVIHIPNLLYETIFLFS